MAPLYFTCAATFSLGLLGLALHRKHFVSALLCLEGMMLALFISLAISMQTAWLTTTATQPLALLCLSACEASAGLALLVASARTHASDLLKTLNLLKC